MERIFSTLSEDESRDASCQGLAAPWQVLAGAVVCGAYGSGAGFF